MAIASRYSRPQTAKPRNDVYIGLLIVALVAMIGSCVLLVIEKQQLSNPPQTKVPAAAAPFNGLEKK
ncbi:MAG TPA: hypothetical protein VGZ47_18005 [Gemmataceae bacterium]|nr:hypothetical protein [Gemmataceae bacterium]